MVAATVYPFFTAPAVDRIMGGLPSAQTVGILMVVLSGLMLSHVPYPLVPRLSVRSVRATISSLLLAACAIAALTVPGYFIFPLLCLYTLWGVTRSTFLGLMYRLPDQDPLLDEDADEDDDGGAEVRTVDYGEIAPAKDRRADDLHPSDTATLTEDAEEIA